MASHQEEAKAGPSGLSVEEMLALLGLDTSEVLVEEDLRALEDGLRRAVDRVLATTPNLHDQDRLYFTPQFQSSHQQFSRMGITCRGMARRRCSLGGSVRSFGASSQQQ